MYGYGLKLLYWTPNFREQKALNIRKNEIDDLITKGDKITVDLDTCEIKENNYIFEKDKRRGRYNSTEDNDLSFEMKIRINSTKSLTNSFDNVDQYQINQSVVVFKMNMNADEKTFYSEVLPYERETLMFLLDTQKETILYIDKNDTSKYYMDMGFLSNHK